MKKRIIALGLAGVALAGLVAVSAAGGSATDPLISKSHLDGVYTTQALTQADSRIAQRHDTIYQSAAAKLKAQYDTFAARLGGQSGSYSPVFTDQRLKRGDVVSVNAGSGFQLLAGTATVSYTGGAVVDVTAGAVQPAGTLAAHHRYLSGENTVAMVKITSPTAVLSLEGYSNLTPSGEVDYNALAGALKTMGLFKGSDTAYGSGMDLEAPPTRIQGLIMFLRLMGEEQAALAVKTASPFRDVPDWCQSYVSYAYEKGYTKGVDAQAMLFGTNQPMGAADYVTFVLRALGYAEGSDFTWASALESAQTLGLLTAGERKLLSQETFLRAHVAYVSYFALDASYQGGQRTLLDLLVSDGVFDRSVVDVVRNSVTVQRLP